MKRYLEYKDERDIIFILEIRGRFSYRTPINIGCRNRHKTPNCEYLIFKQAQISVYPDANNNK